MDASLPTIRAGVPSTNKAVYHAIRFTAHDPAVFITLPTPTGTPRSTLILRDVELERARKHAKANRVYCPKDFTPSEGLSGDREIATAQAAAEYLRRHGAWKVAADRSLPLVFAEHLREAGIEIVFDPELGVRERRSKDEQEVAYMRQAQHDTESAIRMAAELVLKAPARADGVLLHDGQPLTSEVLRTLIDLHLTRLGYVNEPSIIAGGPIGADCHHPGTGELRTGQPVIIDVFPMNKTTLYHGDCTRTVVHGDIPPVVAHMHMLVREAKSAAEHATRAGSTGDAVHRAVVAVLQAGGVHIGFPPADAADDLIFIPHGTGHGLGLDLKEPPLLDFNGVELVSGDVVTIEPALYSRAVGAVRVEDMYVVRDGGCENLDTLPESLKLD